MNRHVVLIGLALVVVLGSAACGGSAPAADVNENFAHEIRFEDSLPAELEPYLDELAGLLPPVTDAGVAVAVIENGETSYAFVGNPAIDQQTLFEFGSITKVFTANVLAQLAGEDLLSLDDSVNDYLPGELQGARWQDVTLKNLATHTAGLPRLPSNLSPFSLVLRGKLDDPYADYDLGLLHEGLRDADLEPPGGSANYSNLGFGWLGTILAQVTGQSYADMVSDRLFEPLGMTGATAEGWSSDAIAPPLDGNGRSVAVWDLDAISGAGAGRGSIEDAATFLLASMTACTADDSVAVTRANCLAQQPSGYVFTDGDEMGLGWIRSMRDGESVIWHNGGTGGFRTFMGFNAERQTGIVLLSNVGGLDAVDEIGMRYLFEQ